MKIIAEIIGETQALLPLNYEIQECFEETLTNEQLSFIHHLQVLMEYAGGVEFTGFNRFGRPSHGNTRFLKAFLAKSLIHRLESDRNLRLICGFSDGQGFP